jgi:DNA-binding transcriptional regulator YdaS (Cro superfamily)
MDLSEYIADTQRRAQLARDLGTDPVYLWQLAKRWRNKRPSPDMARRIEVATDGAVTKESLRPDIWVPEEAEQGAHKQGEAA